jgi:NAD(P)-dependent dehydrogenase (short-subunit alcohol dehydrogenase family)
MDLGLSGRTALVCAASKALGRGCALALARNGVQVTITARTKERLEPGANEIARVSGSAVTPFAGNITVLRRSRRSCFMLCRAVAERIERAQVLLTTEAGPAARPNFVSDQVLRWPLS